MSVGAWLTACEVSHRVLCSRAPCLNGEQYTTLEARLVDEETPWNQLTIAQWYGDGPREVEVATDTAVWYHAGKPPVPIRWVLIRDPHKSFESR
jgi:hypothetical protein